MQLKDFVKDVIVEIAEGITGASKELEGKDVIINPMYTVASPNSDDLMIATQGGARRAQYVQFEVFVNTSNSQDQKAGLSVFAGFIGGGAAAGSSENIASGNLLKFRIPVSFPVNKNKPEDTRR